MFGPAKEVISDLSKRLADNYEKLIQTNAKFDELRQYTKETIDEFKRAIERQEDKIERIERDRVKAETELLTKINALEGRLSAISEQALHLVAEAAAAKIMNDRIHEIEQGNDTTKLSNSKDS